MALTPTIKAPQVGAFAVTSAPASSGLHVTNATAFVVANFPSAELDVSQVGATVVAFRSSNHMNLSQVGVLVVAKGRTYSPKLRAWTYTLDGHDFYVLRLADSKTLVYDLLTGQWSWFTSGDNDYWRLITGMNWYSAGQLPNTYGSNVIVGDDTYGYVWILNPEQGYDFDPSDLEEQMRFPRVASGQTITRERQFLPIYEVYLNASGGFPVADGDVVTLSYSDDAGQSYIEAGDLAVSEGDYTQEFAWRSLGLAVPAGRIFRITDDGAFARIDSLDVEMGEKQ